MDTYRIESDIRDLENQVRSVRDDLDYDLRRGLDELRSEINHLNRRIDSLNQEISGIRDHLTN